MKIVVLGAGGVSKAIVYALKKYTNHITIYNVDETASKDLACRYGVKYAGSPSLLNRNVDYDVLINATSVGFKTEETIVTASQMLENKIVLDVVFTPIETTFVKIAKSLGCTAIEGYKMLIYQACCQFELYTGQAASYDIMEKAVLNKISSNETYK